MARGLTEAAEPADEKPQADLRQIADMLYAIFCAVQEINAKLPESKPTERPVNGL